MTYYLFGTTLMAPLMVQENRQTNTPRGLSYLPGSTLRGAMAGHYLRTGGQPDDAAFKMIFLDSPVHFPDLLPSVQPNQEASPLPMTACSCKRSPGFKTEAGHGVGDSLAALMATQIAGEPMSAAFTCQSCRQDLKPRQGFWNGDAMHPRTCRPVMEDQRHTGIDRLTDTVAPSIFYTTQAMASSRMGADLEHQPQHLTGGVHLNPRQYEMICAMVTDTIFAGADRTRGMGELSATLTPASPPVFDLEAWDGHFRRKVARLTANPLLPGLYFSLDLIGHAIMVDRFLRATADLELDFPGIEPVLHTIRRHRVLGWQASWKLPKPEDVAAAMGGVFLYRYMGDDARGISDYLENLMRHGIGLRRAEGFGRLRVCDPIHIQEEMI
jgi:CRISPR-associated protein Csx10